MKTAGIIGGIGPESTIEYYRLMVAAYHERRPDGSYPPIIINSIDLQKMLGLIAANELAAVTDYLVAEVEKLSRGGADCGLLAAGTPHIVFDEVRRQSPIPLISIVEATRDAATKRGLTRLGLFGARFVMQGRFFPEVFSKAGISLVVPDEDEQALIHDRYMNEMVKGIFLSQTRERLLTIVERLRIQEKIQGLILGGTDMPPIFRDLTDSGIPFLDTTQIHVQAMVAELWP